MADERFVVMESQALPGYWSVFDNERGWVWQGFTNRTKAQKFKEQLDDADEGEYKRLRRYKPSDKRAN